MPESYVLPLKCPHCGEPIVFEVTESADGEAVTVETIWEDLELEVDDEESAEEN